MRLPPLRSPCLSKDRSLNCASPFCSKYLRVAKDNDEVLAFLLGNLIKDRVRYLTVKNGAQPDSVSVRVEELARKAAEIDIHDVQPFFSSPLFVKVHRYQRKGDSIVKSFV